MRDTDSLAAKSLLELKALAFDAIRERSDLEHQVAQASALIAALSQAIAEREHQKQQPPTAATNGTSPLPDQCQTSPT